MATWPSGKAEACKAFTPGSNPGVASMRLDDRSPARPVVVVVAGMRNGCDTLCDERNRVSGPGDEEHMRIGFFTDTYTPQINGVVTSIRLFKSALEARGHDVYVFAPKPRHAEDDDSVVRFRSMPFVFQPEMRLASPLSIDAIKTLDEVRLDLVHSHDPFSIGLYGLSVAARYRIPYVHTYHTLYPEYVHYVWETKLTKRLAERLSRDFCQQCTSIVAPSTKVHDYLRDWGVKRPIEVLATGIDVERYSARDEDRVAEIRRRAQIGSDERVLLYMGRLGREKNVELLLRAMWHSQDHRIKLLIAGDGPHRAELEEITDELDLRGRVCFLGYMKGPDSVAAYHAADAFAFASTTETQGLVIGEAMAAGLPVLTVEDAAVMDFVVDGVNGTAVPSVPEAMGRAMDALFSDETRFHELARAARARANEFSIARQAERLERHYEMATTLYSPTALARLTLPKRKS